MYQQTWPFLLGVVMTAHQHQHCDLSCAAHCHLSVQVSCLACLQEQYANSRTVDKALYLGENRKALDSGRHADSFLVPG